MIQERRLLHQENARAGISPEPGPGAKVLKQLIGFFQSDLADLTDAAVDGWVRGGFIRTFEEGAQVEQGEMGDLVGKSPKMTEITLTNQNVFLRYEKGFRTKQQKLIVLPLKYATDVETQGMIGKEVRVTFEVPQKEKSKPQRFDLALGVKYPEVWAGTIEQAICETLPTLKEEKILGGFEVGRRGRHALYLTQKRVIVARIQPSWPWMILVIISAVFGSIFLGPGLALAVVNPRESSGPIILGLILVAGPLSLVFIVMKRRFKKLRKSPPESTLTANKKNFDIPYQEITRVEVKKGRVGFPGKIAIITNTEKHEFGLGKRERERYGGFIRSVLPDKVFGTLADDERELTMEVAQRSAIRVFDIIPVGSVVGLAVGIVFTLSGIMSVASALILAKIGANLILGSGCLLCGVLSSFSVFSFRRRKNRQGGLLIIAGLLIFAIAAMIALSLESL